MMDSVELDRVRALPGFDAWLPLIVENWRPHEADDAILSNTLRDLGRFVAGLWSLYLDATPGGFTLARLSQVLALTGVSGAGRARSLMIFLRFIGYIEPVPDAGDGRTRVFRPTARMRAAFLERYRREFTAVAVMDPLVGAHAATFDEPGEFDRLMAIFGEVSLGAMQIYRGIDDVSLDPISHRYAGMMVIGELLAAGAGNGAPYPPVGLVRFSLADMARRCGISRTQARRIIKAGEAPGFLEVRGDGEVVLTPLLAEHIQILAASSYIIYRDCKRYLERPAPPAKPPAAAAA